MDTEQRHDSAVIYPFPPGGRRTTAHRGPPRPVPVVTIPSGRAWYHDVAIRDAEGTKDPTPRP